MVKLLNLSKVVRQDHEEPSTFSLGDASGNEWRNIKFDPENETDRELL